MNTEEFEIIENAIIYVEAEIEKEVEKEVEQKKRGRGRPRKYDDKKVAQKKASKEWREKNKDKQSEYNRKYYKELRSAVTRSERPMHPNHMVGGKIETDDGALSCPSCKASNLHQVKVVSEFRFDEDGDGIRTTVTRDEVNTTGQLTDNMKYRRDNLYIHFTCEHCDALPVLAIIQHKGSTLIDWDNYST